MDNSDNSKLAIPLAIVVAGILIAGAVYLGGSGLTGSPSPAENSGDIEINPVGEEDHILGSPNAKMVVVEYSDTECPFCKTFHGTMNQIVDEYGKDGDVAWVYRHFPLDTIHSKARKEAEATECAAELGGEAKFWEYIEKLFEATPSNNNLDPAVLPQIAGEVGLNKDAFNKCLESGRHSARVEADYQDAIGAGASGTPFNVILTRDGQKVSIPGALPYSQMKNIIDTTLPEIE